MSRWDEEIGRDGFTKAILGANGAGKSSLPGAISGVCPVSGKVLLKGDDITTVPPRRRAKMGVAHALEGRRLFRDLTVEINLRLAWSFGRRLTPYEGHWPMSTSNPRSCTKRGLWRQAGSAAVSSRSSSCRRHGGQQRGEERRLGAPSAESLTAPHRQPTDPAKRAQVASRDCRYRNRPVASNAHRSCGRNSVLVRRTARTTRAIEVGAASRTLPPSFPLGWLQLVKHPLWQTLQEWKPGRRRRLPWRNDRRSAARMGSQLSGRGGLHRMCPCHCCWTGRSWCCRVPASEGRKIELKEGGAIKLDKKRFAEYTTTLRVRSRL